MLIICENAEEYRQLMEASRYLHDFVVEDKEGNFVCLEQEIGNVGVLCHLYLGVADFPEKHNMILIKGIETPNRYYYVVVSVEMGERKEKMMTHKIPDPGEKEVPFLVGITKQGPGCAPIQVPVEA